MPNRMAPDSLPISSLNTLEYCPRRFYYQFVQSDMLINEFVLAGTLVHQRVHQAGRQTTVEGGMQTTRLYLYSEALHLSGFADVIEEQGGMLIPVEYKHGKQGKWLNDAIQLCAQALCLEERLADHLSFRSDQLSEASRESGVVGRNTEPEARRGSVVGGLDTEERQPDKPPIPYGYIYYVSSRRRVQVQFTAELRAKTRAAIAQAFQVATLDTPPPPLEGKLTCRCPNCSLVSLCLPDEVKLLQSKKGNPHANTLPH